MANHVLLETIELNQNTASVTFDNIPQTGYSDLKIVVSGRSSRTGTGSGDSFSIAFNGVGGTSYTDIVLRGNGTTPSSYADVSVSTIDLGRVPAVNQTSNTFGNCEIYIPNYTSSAYKLISITGVSENNATEAYAALSGGLFSNTGSITSITIATSNLGSWVPYSSFSLYAIAATSVTPAIAPKATGGNIVANDGTYWYHAFTTSGYFVPQTALTCNILQIAGGGGGGSGSGGGAGGLLAFTAQSLLQTTYYPVTVGAGGVGMDTSGYLGMTNGSNSQFNSLTASVGGGAGKGYNQVGADGGSGGGGAIDATAAGGAGTSGQGFAGGSSTTAYYSGGGGGGAGGVGGTGISTRGGLGGAGVNTYSSWATPTNTGVSGYYAGGGGGGYDWRTYTYAAAAGGAGGGGTGAYLNGNGANGTYATGGGGGAGNVTSGSLYSTGGNGGSGIVIIRYAMV